MMNVASVKPNETHLIACSLRLGKARTITRPISGRIQRELSRKLSLMGRESLVRSGWSSAHGSDPQEWLLGLLIRTPHPSRATKERTKDQGPRTDQPRIQANTPANRPTSATVRNIR